MLSVIFPIVMCSCYGVIMKSAIMQSVIMLSVAFFPITMLGVIMLNVMAPGYHIMLKD